MNISEIQKFVKAMLVDDPEVFAKAAVTSRSVAHVGCSVAVSYTIEG